MSTVVRWGMRFAEPGLDAVHARLDGLRPAAADAIRAAKARFLARHAGAAIDAARLGGPAAPAPLREAHAAMREARREGVPPERALDLAFTAILCPFEGRVYGAAFVGDGAFARFLMEACGAEEFGYDGRGDAPEGVGRSAWRERGRVWGAIAGRDPGARLRGCGVEIHFLERHGPIPVEEVLAQVPSRRGRARALARDEVLESRTQANGNTIPAAVAAVDWLLAPEGGRAWAEAADRIAARLDDIDAGLLRGDEA